MKYKVPIIIYDLSCTTFGSSCTRKAQSVEFRLRAPCCRPLFHTLLENQRGKQVLHSPEPLILPFE